EFPEATVTEASGVPVLEPDTSGIAEAVAAAEAADVAVLAVGDIAGLFGAGTSGEGCDVADLRLPGAQHELVEAVLATGTPVVLVLVTGRPYALGNYVERCAAASDVAVLAVGDIAGLFGAGTSGEGCARADPRLPGAQHELVEAVLATGTPVVLVLGTGRPYALGNYVERCAAIVQALMPGEEGGSALAGVLSGRVNPSGRLPIGIPGGMGGQPGTYLAPVLAWVSDGISN